MNYIELSAILYYADFLSLLQTSTPVTDICKYFFIHGTPINAAYIVDLEPVFDTENKYYLLALQEYNAVKGKFDEEGVMSFLEDIAFIRACGCVDGERMLNVIHQFDSKFERKEALNTYRLWKKNISYTRIIKDESGNEIEQPRTKYVYHFEKVCKK